MRRVFENQAYHLLAYLMLGALLYWATLSVPVGRGRLWGVSTAEWVGLSWLLAGAHQGWVGFFWRTQLHGGLIKKRLGGSGFVLFAVGFVLFGGSRMLMIIPIAASSARSVPIPGFVSLTLLVGTTPFILWGLFSVLFYFGLKRSFGTDHFDPAYRGGTLEKRGIFKYVPNAMYTVVLLAIYHPGLLFESTLGLIAAAAHHAFVWCHYFCTERPDMRHIYGRREPQDAEPLA